MDKMKSYTELSAIDSFEDRFKYLATNQRVGDETFGSARYLNQDFYRSKEWRSIKDKVIIRDSVNGTPCDLGCSSHPIAGRVVIHHINPITIDDLKSGSNRLTDLDNLVCVSELTHKAIHYSNADLLPKQYIPRRPNDTIPWR